MRPRLLAMLFVVCGIFVGSADARADLINVLVLDFDTNDAGFATDGRYEDAYSAMLDAANFGATGTVTDRTFNFLSSVSSLSAASLGNVGLVIVAHRDGVSPTWTSTGDVAKIRDYVSGGGSVLTLGHGMTYNWGVALAEPPHSLSEELAGRFPAPHHFDLAPTNGLHAPLGSFMEDNPLAAGDGIIDGSFGAVATVSSTENAFWTGSTGSSTGKFALQYSTAGPSNWDDGLYGEFGSGRFVMIGSTDMLLAPQYQSVTDNNAAFFLNSIEYLTQDTISASTPEPSSLVLMASLGVAVWIRRRKKPVA